MLKMMRNRPRAPPRAMERFFLWTAPGLTEVVIAGERLDDEVLDDEGVLDDEEVVDEDVAEDEVGPISVYLYPKSVEEIGVINERTQTLDGLRSHIFPPAQRILRAYVVYSPTPWSSRRLGTVQSRLTLYLAHYDQVGR